MANIYVAATGNDTTGDGSSGNPYASIGKAGSVLAAGDTIFLKYSASPYVLTSGTANVAGGRLSFTGGGEGNMTHVVGYDTNDTVNNTDANRPTIEVPGDGSVTGITVISFGSNYMGIRCRNLIVDGNGQASVVGFAADTRGAQFERCKAVDCTTGFSSAKVLRCWASGCGVGFGSCPAVGCVSQGHTSRGFYIGGHSDTTLFCVAKGGTGATADGFLCDAMDKEPILFGCVAYDNDRDGFRFESFARVALVGNCIAYGNGGYGFNAGAGNLTVAAFHTNAGDSNTSGETTFLVATMSVNFIQLTADPFVNAAAGDFALNNTAGGGALLRALGLPGVFLDGLTESFLDIGAAQHEDAGGGSGARGSLLRGLVG